MSTIADYGNAAHPTGGHQAEPSPRSRATEELGYLEETAALRLQAPLGWPQGVGGRWRRQPLHCRYPQPPHPESGFLRNHHHHRGDRGYRIRCRGLRRGRRPCGPGTPEFSQTRGGRRRRQRLYRRYRQPPHPANRHQRDHHHYRGDRRRRIRWRQRPGKPRKAERAYGPDGRRRRRCLRRRYLQQPNSRLDAVIRPNPSTRPAA